MEEVNQNMESKSQIIKGDEIDLIEVAINTEEIKK